jgi:hypothetical protein
MSLDPDRPRPQDAGLRSSLSIPWLEPTICKCHIYTNTNHTQPITCSQPGLNACSSTPFTYYVTHVQGIVRGFWARVLQTTDVEFSQHALPVSWVHNSSQRPKSSLGRVQSCGAVAMKMVGLHLCHESLPPFDLASCALLTITIFIARQSCPNPASLSGGR